MREDDIDAMIEMTAPEEQDEINRKQGQAILGMFEEHAKRRQEDPLVKLALESLASLRQQERDNQT